MAKRNGVAQEPSKAPRPVTDESDDESDDELDEEGEAEENPGPA